MFLCQKERNYYKKNERSKGKVHVLNFLKGDILKGIHITMEVFFKAESWVERLSFLSIYETCMIF